ncbi:MAG TPA: 16S rRNA (guanine(966)-N(2))-methyltransferase RsmD [Lachnospiraceae bacterium]|nr:16S rRNA (guanine(966)-N(2))-methyltransferase RsmD [Lachnospiraceae bacterium]
MRVIAGKCRRLNLDTIKGDNTRPTTDRIKETLFNIISDEVVDSDFLDLFSGSGQIGIEALSRYASSATFVDNYRLAIDCINSNIKRCRLEDNSNVICDNVFSAIKRFKDNSFDIVFLDPPYNKGFERDILKYLDESSIIRNDGLIIVEADLNTDFTYLNKYSLELERIKEYKTNKHLFLRKRY